MRSTKIDNNWKFRSSWKEETGKLPFPLTNDYLFKALTQENLVALKDLISACIHIKERKIRSISIMNPIVLGEQIDEKMFVLDVRVLMNNHTIINLEMQVLNYHDWPERSLQYLCRSFNSLHSGENYLDSKIAIHVSILDFNLFPKGSTLHASNRMMNVKTHKVYSDKLQLYTICLPRAKKPSEEDKYYHTDLWASFFKAKTWEDLKMLAKESEAIETASATIHKLIAQQKIRDQIQAREDYYRRMRTEELKKQKLVKDLQAAKKEAEEAEKAKMEAEKARKEAQLDAEKARKEAEMAKNENADAKKEIERLRKLLEANGIK